MHTRVAGNANFLGKFCTDFGGPSRRGHTDFDVTTLKVDFVAPGTVVAFDLRAVVLDNDFVLVGALTWAEVTNDLKIVGVVSNVSVLRVALPRSAPHQPEVRLETPARFVIKGRRHRFDPNRFALAGAGPTEPAGRCLLARLGEDVEYWLIAVVDDQDPQSICARVLVAEDAGTCAGEQACGDDERAGQGRPASIGFSRCGRGWV